jgi:thiamine-phosphate pyrophosphorylase
MTRRERLARARLYLIGDAPTLARVIDPALAGGVDIVQLRAKGARPSALRPAALAYRDRCWAAGALFVINDDPEFAAAVDADGVHVGQNDMPPAAARAIVGDDCLIGLSTHLPAQIDAAAGADYIGVGPVFATPTKPGRAPVGLALVQYAAANAAVPFFAIGGIDVGNAASLNAAGATRIAVVRAIGDAADPQATARMLRSEAVAVV